MASGSWTFNTQNSTIQGMVKWYSKNNGAIKNSSHVGVTVYFKKTVANYALSGTVNTYGTITGGAQKKELNYNLKLSDPNTWSVVFAKEWDVNHNNDGSKQIEIHIWGNSNFSLKTFDTKKTVTLDKIARYTSIKKWEVAEVGKTYAKLNWQTADTVDWLCTYLNDSGNWTNITSDGGISATSGNFIYKGMNNSDHDIPSVSTLKPGTTYKLKLWVRRKDTRLGTYSSNLTFTTKSVAAISNLSNNFSFIIGDNLSLAFKNYSQNKSWLSLEIQKTDKTWEQIIKTDEVIQQENYVWTLSSYASTLYAKLSTRNSAPMRVRCGTTISENGQTFSCIASEYTGTIIVKNSNPIFNDFECLESNNRIQDALGNPLYTLQNHGKMTIRIPVSSKAIAQNGAVIIKYCMQLEGVINAKQEIAYKPSTEFTYTTSVFLQSGTGKVSIYAVDSRGNQSQIISKTFTVLPYKIPTLSNINLKRLNGYETEIVLDFKGTVSKLIVDGVDKNTSITVSYQTAESESELANLYRIIEGVKIDSDSSDTQHLLSFAQNTENNTFGIFGENSDKMELDNNKPYFFQFRIEDAFTSTPYNIFVEKGIPGMFISDNGVVSINMIPDITREEKFQIHSDILIVDKNGSKFGLLSELRKLIYGTDWVKVTMKNGSSTPDNSNALSVRKYGNIVYMMGWITVTSQKAGTIIASVPDKYKPLRHFRQLVPRYDVRFGNIGISPNGDITMIHDTNMDESSKVYYIDMTWVTSSNSSDFSETEPIADMIASDMSMSAEPTM